MRFSAKRIREFAATRGLSLSAILREAGVSRTAYYSLARRTSAFPRSASRLAAPRAARVEIFVVGLSAASLQGAPVATRNVDLWVSDVGDEKPATVRRPSDMFKIVVSMHGLNSFAVEYRRSREIKVGTAKVRVRPLDRIIASKRAVNRPQDRAVLPVLEDVLRTITEALPSQYAVPRRKRTRRRNS
jgi:transcriptional regulator with XRE-family HTH domain